MAALYPKGRAPADPAKRPSLLVPLEGSRKPSCPAPTPARPGHRSPREGLWAAPAVPAEQLLPAAHGDHGKLRQHSTNYVIRRSFAHGSRKLDYSRVRLLVDDTSSGAEARQRVRLPGTARIPAGRARDPRAWRAWSRGGAASGYRDSGCATDWKGRGLLPPRQQSRGSVRGKAAKGLGAPRRGRGAAGGAGTDLAGGAVTQHHQLELAVRTLLLLRVRHDLYGPGGKEEAESSREEPGAGARTGQREGRAPRSRSWQQRWNHHRHLPSARPPSLWSARGETNGRAEERGRSGNLRARATATSPAASSGHTH